jgi:PEP-CTERM motif
MSAALSLLTAGFAEATTYTASRSIGDGSVDLSITTDGTLGTLKFANILDWTVVLTRDGLAVTANGANSSFQISGNAFSATATDLLFNYSPDFSFIRVLTSELAFSDRSWWCTGKYCATDADAPGAAEFLSISPFVPGYTYQQYSGVQTIASISDAVPEPATWAMMIVGFGAVGSMVRASRRRNAFSVA